MKQMKKWLSGLMALAMMLTLLPATALAAENTVTVTETAEVEQILDMPEIQTTGEALMTLALDEDGVPTISSENEVLWVDRLADLPDYARSFYAWLVENSDGDGTEDALIDPTTGTAYNAHYVYPIATLSDQTASFTFASGASSDEIGAAASAAASAAAQQSANEICAYSVAVYSAFDRDHPEVFWLSGSSKYSSGYSYTYSYSPSTCTGTVTYTQTIRFYLQRSDGFDVRDGEYLDKDLIHTTISQRDADVASIIAGASGTRLEQIQYLNTRLTQSNCYNSSSDLSSIGHDCRECVSALEGRTGTDGPVCEGYARAFMVLCQALEIPCVLVNGTANGGGHMWNYVQMEDGKWYAVDVTWNDPMVSGVTGAESGYESERYLLVGSTTTVSGEAFSVSHELTNRVTSNGTAFTNGPALEEVDYFTNLANTPAEPELFDIAFASMTMGNSLAINFAFAQDALSDWEGCYVEIVKTYADDRTDVVETVPYAQWKKATINSVSHYYVTFDGIAAKEMTDEIYVTVYNASGEAVSNTKTDSVQAQSMRIIDTVSDLEKTMIVDMLNYGTAAQGYFGYAETDLANGLLSDAQKACASEPKECTDTRSSSNSSYYASNVNLESNIQLMFAFRNVDATMRAVVTFRDHWNTALSYEIPGSDFAENGGFYVVTVEALVVADGRQDVTCVIYDADGNEVSSVTDSLESYTARKNGESELFTRMMQYSDSAYAYFHS